MSRFTVALLIVAIGMGSFAVTTRAADDKGEKGDKAAAAFKALDKNGDGKLSKDEYVGKKKGEGKTKAEDEFKKLDANSDGSLSLDEFKPGYKDAEKPEKPGKNK